MAEVQPFGVKFQEAIDYLKGKLPEASMRWDDLAGPVHAKVFTVAGATSAAMAGEIQTSLVKALEEGKTISQFRKDFDQVVAKHGWSYNGKRGWRSALIFNTNMRSASMAGRWTQLQLNKANRPYLQYRTAGDARVRPQHRLWDGMLRHIDDPFWRTHYPPNGWNCRCTIRAYSQGEIDDDGLKVQSVPYKIVYRDVANKEGFIDRVPVGIDQGWDHNVGMSWVDPELSLGAKLATLPRAMRGPMVDKTISPAFQTAIEGNWKAFRTRIAETKQVQKLPQILGFLDSATLNGLDTQVPELKLETSALAAMDNKTVHLEGGHKAIGNPAQVWSPEMIDQLPSMLRNYRAVLWDLVSGTLVFVPQENMPTEKERWPKVVIRPNQRSKYGMVMSVVSLGSAEPSDYRDGNRYRVLVGKVK